MSLTAQTSSSNQTPLQLAFQTLLAATSFTTPDETRKLILGLDITVASYGFRGEDRDAVSCPDNELAGELIITASPLAKIPAALGDCLLEDIEDLLVRYSPKAFLAYAAKRQLWNDDAAWERNIGLLASHVGDADARHKLIAVLASHLFPEALNP